MDFSDLRIFERLLRASHSPLAAGVRVRRDAAAQAWAAPPAELLDDEIGSETRTASFAPSMAHARKKLAAQAAAALQTAHVPRTVGEFEHVLTDYRSYLQLTPVKERVRPVIKKLNDLYAAWRPQGPPPTR